MENNKYGISFYESEGNVINLNLYLSEWQKLYQSIKEGIPNIEQNFYDKIVKNLKQEAEKLNNKLTKIRENQAQDMNLYISTLKSLRETLDLISKYDWKLMYSEYTIPIENKDNKNIIQYFNRISVWEQNHDKQIRNHKVWNVSKVEAEDN